MARTIISARSVMVAVVFLLAGVVVDAGLPLSVAANQADTKDQADAKSSAAPFVRAATEGDMAEVKLGELATQNGDDTTVKDFGKRMITDHTSANNKLQKIASKDGLTVPDDLNARDRATYDRLAKLKGAAFDKAYARLMVKDHQGDIAEFKREANSETNQDVKNFAAATLPNLEEHFRLAQTMLREVTGGTSSGTPLKPSSH